jgi:hypothetical protein
MAAPSASDDLEIARALQAEYDREHRELQQQNSHNRFQLTTDLMALDQMTVYLPAFFNNFLESITSNHLILKQEFGLS